MARGIIMGGISVGLSALLAVLLTARLLADAPATPREAQQAGKQVAAKPAVKKRRPQSVILPQPPPPLGLSLAAPHPSMKPKAKAAPMKVLQPSPPKAAAPTAAPVVKAIKVRKRPKKQKPGSSVKSEPAKQPAKKPIVERAAVAAQGRVLLRLLEHGQGPAIELAWPWNGPARARLYRRFRDCFGMQVALSLGPGRELGGQLFIAKGPAGAAWRPNRDRYSGFARQPSGRLAPAERDDLAAIAQHHGLRHDLTAAAAAMRIFPRAVDARLLGGLDRQLAGGYGKAGSIRARYHLDGRRILVRDIQVDGRAIPGTVDLGRTCGGA